MIVTYGGGAMGKSLLAGLVRGGRDADDLAVFDRSAEHPRTLAERYGARQAEAEEGAASAAAVLLVVPPKPVPSLPARIAPVLRPECLVLSLAAGLHTGEVERALRTGTPAVRVIPNTAVEVGQGMCVLSGPPCRAGPDRRGVPPVRPARGHGRGPGGAAGRRHCLGRLGSRVLQLRDRAPGGGHRARARPRRRPPDGRRRRLTQRLRRLSRRALSRAVPKRKGARRRARGRAHSVRRRPRPSGRRGGTTSTSDRVLSPDRYPALLSVIRA